LADFTLLLLFLFGTAEIASGCSTMAPMASTSVARLDLRSELLLAIAHARSPCAVVAE
jgi:hypothetical protein